MKEKELRKVVTCGLCKRKIGSCGLPMFWRVIVERHGLNISAIKRQAALTEMLGGNASLAITMGADDDMTMPLMDPVAVTVCEECGMKNTCVAQLADSPDSQPEGERSGR